MNLQKLLEKDAGLKSNRSWSPTSNKATDSSGRGYHAGVLKDKKPESANERRLTANKLQVVLSQHMPPQQTQEVILLEKASLPEKDNRPSNTDKKVKASSSSKTSDISKSSSIESRNSEQKEKVKKTLSPSLFALIEKDAKESQSFKEEHGKDNRKVEVNGHSSPASGESVSKSNELSNSWEAFEQKLQSNLKKNTDSRGRHNMHDSQGTHGSHDTQGIIDSRGSQSENVKILIEDSTDAGKEREKIERQFSAEGRNTKDKELRWKVDLPDKTDAGMPSVNLSRSSSGSTQNEEVKLSVNGDELTVPSVRARQNSFLNAEENNETNGADGNGGRGRGHSFSSSNDHKTVIIEDAINEPNAMKASSKGIGSRERGSSFSLSDDSKTVIIEDDTVSNNLHSASRTTSRVSNASEGRERKNSSSGRETSSESSEAKTRTTSFGKSETGQRLATDGKAKDEEVAKMNGRSMPKTLADLLARDDKSSPEHQEQVASEKAPVDNTNFYKDKLKGLKKVTPYYASGPIKLRDRSGSANQEASHTGSANHEKVPLTPTNSVNQENTIHSSSTNKEKSVNTSSANKEKSITTSSANQEEKIITTTLANQVQASPGLQIELDKLEHIDINNNQSQSKDTSQNVASNTTVFKSNSIESSSSQKRKFIAEDKKQETSEKVTSSVGPSFGELYSSAFFDWYYNYRI